MRHAAPYADGRDGPPTEPDATEEAPAGSVAALAALIGRSERATFRHLSRPDWPVHRRAPWTAADVATIRQWLAGLKSGGARGGLGDAERAARVRLLLERARLLQLKRGVESGRYLLRDDVDAMNVRRVLAVKAALFRLPRELAPLCVGRDAATIQVMIEARVRDICEEFARG